MNIKPVMARLRDGGFGFRSVTSAPTLADALEGQGVQFPCAVVVMPRETAEPSKRIHDDGPGVPHRQRVSGNLSIVIGVKAAAANPDVLTDDLTDLGDAVIGSVAGWRAPDADTKFEYSGAALMRIADGLAFRELRFACDWFIRTNPAP